MIMYLRPHYRYTLYGKERNIDTGIHPITIHVTKIGAYFSMLRKMKEYTKLHIA